MKKAAGRSARRFRCHLIWLGILDSNQGYLIQSQAAYR